VRAATATAELPEGVGYSWRPLLADALAAQQLPIVEAIFDDLALLPTLPPELLEYRDAGVPILLHSVGLSVCGADPVDRDRVSEIARMAEVLGAPVVSDHLAFVSSDGWQALHLIPPPRIRDAIAVAVDNLRVIAGEMPVPIAVENIAPTFGWPEDSVDLADFVAEVVERSGVSLLLDLENLHAAEWNLRLSADQSLARLAELPLAYLHVAGGSYQDGIYHDTHSRQPSERALELLSAVTELGVTAPVVIERDVGALTTAQVAEEVASVVANIR
jgi:uncharacterized protein